MSNAIRMVLGAVTVGLTLAAAHETWLQPERFAATPGARLAVDLTGADAFGNGSVAIRADRVARTVGRLGGGELGAGVAMTTARSLRWSVTLTRPGVAVLGAELKPEVMEIAAEEIEVRFRELHAGDDLREFWAAVPEPRRWRERAVRSMKTFVRVGEPPAEDRGWNEPLGFALEIVPERDPTALREGEALAVRVLREGRPRPGFVIAFLSAGETREHVAVTDADGRASAGLDAKGAWLVSGTELRRTAGSGGEWESERATMVVEVR